MDDPVGAPVAAAFPPPPTAGDQPTLEPVDHPEDGLVDGPIAGLSLD